MPRICQLSACCLCRGGPCNDEGSWKCWIIYRQALGEPLKKGEAVVVRQGDRVRVYLCTARFLVPVKNLQSVAINGEETRFNRLSSWPVKLELRLVRLDSERFPVSPAVATGNRNLGVRRYLLSVLDI